MMKYVLKLQEKLADGEKFNRVHAMLLTSDGRVLLRYKNGEPRVTGGRIDAGDQDLESALKREVREELNCKIDKCDYLGYIEAINTKTNERENWARMVARVSKIGKPTPDLDRSGNWIYGRTLAPRETAAIELEKIPVFGVNNIKVLDAGYKIACEKEYFMELPNSEYEVLNVEKHD